MTLRWWQFSLALVASLAIHGGVDLWLRDAEDPVRIAGVANAQIAIIGNTTADMVAAGAEVEPVVAEAVQVAETVQTRTVKPAQVEAVKAVASAELAMAAALPVSQSALPVIAAAPVDIYEKAKTPRLEQTPVEKSEPAESADPAAAKAAKEKLEQAKPEKAAETAKPLEAASPVKPTEAKAKPAEDVKTAQPVKTVPVEKAPEKKLDKVKPVETAALVKPIEPKPQVKKKKTVKKKGKKGRSSKSAKKGRADGSTAVAKKSAGDSKKGRNKGVAGNAAVSNYPGKVRRKLSRALRYPKKARSAKLRGTVKVRFSVGAGGAVTVSGIARSSGSPILDSAALATVRRAAPFPKIPAAAGRKSWTFTVPLEFTPRSR